MKYHNHWMFKLLALLLAFISGAVLILGAAGMVLTRTSWYSDVQRGRLYNNVSTYCSHAAEAVFDNFAWRDTGIEPRLFERFFRWGADVDAVDSLEHPFYYSIRDTRTGEKLESNVSAGLEWGWDGWFNFDVRRGYVTEMPKAVYYPGFDQFMAAEAGMVYADQTGQALPPLGEGVTDYEYYVVSDDDSVNWQNISMPNFNHADAGGADYTIYRMEYTVYESYEVDMYMTPEQMAALMDDPMEDDFLPRFAEKHGEVFAPMTIWGGLVLLMSILWLTLVAGKSPSREELKPQGLNRIPLDIWLVLTVLGAAGLIILTVELMESMMLNFIWDGYDGSGGMETFWLQTALLGLIGGGAGLLAAMFLMAVAAQMKMGDGYWLKHTAVGLSWRYGWKIVLRAAKWCWSTAKRVVRWFLGLFAAIGTFCKRLADLLPLSWQWLIASGCVWALMLFCCIVGINSWEPWLIFFGIAVTALLVVYGAYCFGILRDAARKMSGGRLEEKVEDRLLLGCFGEFAGHLNALGDTCVESARRQMKSERMKSELITNVSHDIKTPLTSIINYVDLLQKTDEEARRAEYLEVLDRQSQQLKKLIEDLMEMSRASSGNVAVEITPTDLVESVNQALGEFIDKLDGCGLTVLLKAPQEPLMALCDGKHLWRVLSNCLSNVVKYAMPGTRVYVDVTDRGSKAEISVKNISAEMLNVSAEELMERFVRGDSSRNTEGNGLGLNIAKSLMELQGGSLDLVVDGDLFKVVLTLNSADRETGIGTS